MSHNNVKIGTAEPNSSGEFTVALNNLSDVSGTPSDGELLQYSSGAWAPASVSGSATIQYLKWGNGEAEPYDDSPATSMAAGQTLYLYDENGYNGISGATVSSTTSTGTGGGEWLNSVTLPAGTYRIVLNVDVVFSGTGYMTFAVFDGASRVTSQGSIGTATSTLGAGGPTSEAILVLTASTTLNAEITAVSSVDSVVNQGDTIAEHGFLLIEKMG